MLGPIIAQRHQQLLAKFGSVGTVWRKLFENPKAQCLLGCLSQFGFGGTGGFDYALQGVEGTELGEVHDGVGGGSDAASCEPGMENSSSSSSSSSSSRHGHVPSIDSTGSSKALTDAAAAAGFAIPPGFNLSGMSPSDMKAAAASVGITLPGNFDISAFQGFGSGGRGAAFGASSSSSSSAAAAAAAAAASLSSSSASLPPLHARSDEHAPPLAPPSLPINPALIAATFGLAPPARGKKTTVDKLEQRLRKLSTSDAAFEGMDSDTQAVIAAQCSPDVWRAMTMDDIQASVMDRDRDIENLSGELTFFTPGPMAFAAQLSLEVAIETLGTVGPVNRAIALALTNPLHELPQLLGINVVIPPEQHVEIKGSKPSPSASSSFSSAAAAAAETAAAAAAAAAASASTPATTFEARSAASFKLSSSSSTAAAAAPAAPAAPAASPFLPGVGQTYGGFAKTGLVIMAYSYIIIALQYWH